MFTDKQIEILNQELNNNRIKSRAKGNITLSYLEGFDILDTANKVFGYGNWSYTITKLEPVSSELNQNQNHIICYKAIVNITVDNIDHTQRINREDVGFGTGIAKTLADAHEGGAKEAITDSIKRTLRGFGNQFGNSLYDKSRLHKNNQPQNHQPANNTQQYQPQQNNQQQHYQKPHSNQNDYKSLQDAGLSVMEQGNNLVVVGDDIFNKKNIIKSNNFFWDSTNKQWFKPLNQVA